MDMYKSLTGLALATLASAAVAADLDGKSRMICAATQAVVCESAGDCVTGAPGAVNLPVFWQFDPAAKAVTSRVHAGGERTSAIDIINHEGGKLVLQGSDEGFGWSMTVDSADGRMLLTGGRDVGYLVFGECTPR